MRGQKILEKQAFLAKMCIFERPFYRGLQLPIPLSPLGYATGYLTGLII
jgi:hypothetical protein